MFERVVVCRALAFCYTEKCSSVHFQLCVFYVPREVRNGCGKKASAMSAVFDQPAAKNRALTVTKDWPLYRIMADGDSRTRCKICDKNFSVSHGGENDITRHAAGLSHKTLCYAENTNKPMTEFVMTFHPNTK